MSRALCTLFGSALPVELTAFGLLILAGLWL